MRIKATANLIAQIIDCDEDDLIDRLNRAAPTDGEVAVWLKAQQERAFSVKMKQNSLTAQYLDSIYRYDDGPCGPTS